jgi:hypothetical protein
MSLVRVPPFIGRSTMSRLLFASVLLGGLFAASPLVALGPPSAAAAADTTLAKPALTLHVTDLGINREWSVALPMVGGFDPKGQFHSVFDADAPNLGHLLLAMPSDQELAAIPAPRLRQLMAARLEAAIRQQMAQGVSEFEIQLVQNIKDLGKYLMPDRQQKVAQFGNIAYGALGDAIADLKSQTSHIAVDAHLGSNGSTVFAKAVAAWLPYRHLIARVTYVNGRALLAEAISAIKALGAEKTRIIVSDWDAPAPVPWSIANADVARDLVAQFPKLTMLRLLARDYNPLTAADPDFQKQHIRSLLHGDVRFDVYDGADRWLGTFARDQIHPRLTSAAYRALGANLPPVASQPASQTAGVPLQTAPAGDRREAELARAGRAIARDPAMTEKIHRAVAALPPVFVFGEALDRTLDVLHHFTKETTLVLNAGAIAAEGLKQAKSPVPESVEKIMQIHDFLTAMKKDFDDAGSGEYRLLSSHTLEEGFKIGLGLILEENQFGLSFGAADAAAAVGQLLGANRRVDDPDVVAQLLDGINKSAWGGVGLLLSNGNKVVGDTFAAIADHAAQAGRDLTLPLFERAYSRDHKIDQALVDRYVAAQEAHKAHGQPVESIEDFYKYDNRILRLLDAQQRRDIDSRYHQPSGSGPPAPVTMVTRTVQEHYREVCRAGFCVRTELDAAGRPPSPLTDAGPVQGPVAPTAAISAPPATANREQSSKTSSQPIGGIEVASAWLAENLPPIRAVVVDPDSNAVVLVGDATLKSDLRPRDVLVALAVIRSGHEITFSLDPEDRHNPSGKWLKAVYSPEWLGSQSTGACLFDSDLLLKAYGYAVKIGADGKIVPWKSPLPGYKSYADLVMEAANGKPVSSQWSRFWLVSSHAVMRATTDAVVLDLSLAVKARRQVPDPASPTGLRDIDTASDGPESRWAELMTANLKEFHEAAAWGRLEQLARAVAFSKWLLSHKEWRVDFDQVTRLVNAELTRNVARISALDLVRRSQRREPLADGRGERIIESELHLFGGVDLGFDPERLPDNGEGRAIADKVRQALRDHPAKIAFTFTQGNETLRAVVIPILAPAPAGIATAPPR